MFFYGTQCINSEKFGRFLVVIFSRYVVKWSSIIASWRHLHCSFHNTWCDSSCTHLRAMGGHKWTCPP